MTVFYASGDKMNCYEIYNLCAADRGNARLHDINNKLLQIALSDANNKLSDTAMLREVVITAYGVEKQNVEKTSDNFRFVAAVAEFGMLLNNSAFKQGSSFENARNLASGAIGNDEEGYRKEFIELIGKARKLVRRQDVSKSEE